MIEHTADYKGTQVKFVWHPLNNLEGIEPIHQVYALCFTKDGKVLIIRNPIDGGKFTPWYLPGGTPEKGETSEQTLVRELDEEADISVSNIKLLGAQEVFYPNNPNKQKGAHYYQLRYFALIEDTREQTLDTHDNEMVELKYINPGEYTEHIEWGDIGKALLEQSVVEFLKLNMTNHLPYRQGVYAFVLNKDKDSILMVLKKNSGVWDCPGGGIDEGETSEQAVKRELLEELGTDKFEVLHNSSHKYSYDWPLKEIEKNIKKSGKLMRGQEQSFLILSLVGSDNAIELQNEELAEYKWIKLSELKNYMAYPDFFEHVQKVLSEYGIGSLK